MDALQFAYWLQGFSEIHGNPPTDAQWKVIQDHLALVFSKVTPRPSLDGGQRNMSMQQLLSQCQQSNGQPLVATC
jgi:hypothetical protein